MVTSEIYAERLRPEHAQAVSGNSSRIMFVCMCRCADARVCQKRKKNGGGGGMEDGEDGDGGARGKRPREREEGGWGGERRRIFGDI